MEAENRGPEDVQLGDAAFDEYVPERWETAVEDLAQVVALGLDRAQDLADAVNDFTRGHPIVSKSLLAAVGGVVVGLLVADRVRPRPPNLAERSRAAAEGAAQAAREGVERVLPRAQRAAAQAAAAAQSAAEGVPPRLSGGRLHWHQASYSHNGRSMPGPAKSLASASGQMRYWAELAPLAVALLRNPLVREFLLRAAVRARSGSR